MKDLCISVYVVFICNFHSHLIKLCQSYMYLQISLSGKNSTRSICNVERCPSVVRGPSEVHGFSMAKFFIPWSSDWYY